MLDKKTVETIDTLIKKIKDNNLGSIKLSNKVTTIEISNNTVVVQVIIIIIPLLSIKI